jgi:regulatory protein
VGHGRGRDRPTRRRDVHERALGLLAARQRSRKEVERRLVGAGFDAGDVEAELGRLEAVGLIDDQKFARAVAEHALGARREGRRLIAGRLATAGVDRTIAAEVLDEVSGEGEEERAVALAQSRTARLIDLPADKAFSRLYGLLARRGYAPDVARRAARRALAVEGFED